jgi:hypothetical protein
MHLRDVGGTVWLVKEDDEEVRLKDLSPQERGDILDVLVHDTKADEASAINNAGEADQVAYLLGALCRQPGAGPRPTTDPAGGGSVPTPGSVLAALVTVLVDRGHDPALITARVGQVDEDELWQHYLGPAVDRLEFLLDLDGGAGHG